MTSELITSGGKVFSSSTLFAVANASKILPNFGSRNLAKTINYLRDLIGG